MKASIAWLCDQQLPDGSFAAWSGDSLVDCSPTRQQQTAFHTSLIVDCLKSVPGTAALRQQAARYLQSQASEQGSWNYWIKGSEAAHQQPYPDDLDDTACALAAINAADGSLDPQQLGQFARLLVSVEAASGGPYRTWLTNDQTWQQIDLAVNANIGYVLAQQQVTPTGLRSYIETAIAANTYQSTFYIGELPSLYFISRWYFGAEQPRLQQKLISLLDTADQLNDLHQALLISAAQYQHITDTRLQTLRDRLLARCAQQHWRAEAFYDDPAYDGKACFSGSAALTTAFVLEALHLDSSAAISEPKRLSLRSKRLTLSSMPSASLQRQYSQLTRRVLQGPSGTQIGSAASLFAAASGWPVSRSKLRSLDSACLHGWIAYTAYDDILDNAANSSQLCVANVALRRSYEQFLTAAGKQHIGYVRQTFDRMDAANDWEIHHARAVVAKDVIRIRRLPDYGDLHQLAERSLGHRLAGCLIALLHRDNPQTLADLESFFWHFLIARQLNDDAHDWEQHLQAGQLSVVVVWLLQDHGFERGSLRFGSQRSTLQQCFWRHTIDTVCEQIIYHTNQARRALASLQLADAGLLEAWLQALEQSAAAALKGRDEAEIFMQAYGAKHVV